MCAKTYEVYDKIKSPVEESFKTLRTNILFSINEKKIKSITIVSCNHKEGKTSVAINLSISMANSNMKVLLVDADLRKPTGFKRLGGENLSGLTDYLTGEASLTQIISSTSIKNLHYVSCGPKQPNPAELISSRNFSQFIKTVEEIFDIVLIDTSAIGSVIDGAVIASQTDGTIIVIASRSLEQAKALRLKEQLEKANANIIGVVLNKVMRRDYKVFNLFYNDIWYYDNYDNIRKSSNNMYNKSGKGGIVHHD